MTSIQLNSQGYACFPGFRFDFNKTRGDWWIKGISKWTLTVKVPVKLLGETQTMITNLKNTRKLLKDMFQHSLCHLHFNENDQNGAIYIGSYKYKNSKADHMLS